MPPLEGEILVVKLRLIGNVTETVYAEAEVSAESLYKDPDLYLGYAHLAIPFLPANPGTGTRPEFDPADTQIILQAATASPNTVIGNTGEGGGNATSGHWLGTIEFRPEATVEIPNGIIS